jgi:hypothetical protein
MIKLHGHAMRGKQTYQMIELREPRLASHVCGNG